jgi:spermidine synthase
VTYYHVNGPVGQIFHSLQQSDSTRNVGAVGLGTGSILCYARPHEHWTFFEIDWHVWRIARTPGLFSFLEDCPVKPRVVLGDARLTIAKEPAAKYSLLVLDAFSSDAIPIHLMTREAFVSYKRVLTEHGLLLIHVSNRRLDLEPVVGALARDAGLSGRIRNHDLANEIQNKTFEYGSDWVLLAKHPEDLGVTLTDSRWRGLEAAPLNKIWTDDYSNLLSVIKW